MNKKIHLVTTIPRTLANKRLDAALAVLFPTYSRACLQGWIKSKQVEVNQSPAKPKDKMHGGEAIVIHAECVTDESWAPQAIPINIIHEDDALLVVNKSANTVVHPAAGNPDHTLVNALVYHYPELAALPRAGLIHRLDKDTTGLLVVAKTLESHHYLVKTLQARLIQREYEAIVHGHVISGGRVNQPIGRHPKHRTKMAVVERGKSALTHYRILKHFEHYTHLHLQLETGRTHQIRVHMASINHPIMGDKLYSPHKHPFPRQALHARRLTFKHPDTQSLMTWEAPLPEDMENVIIYSAR